MWKNKVQFCLTREVVGSRNIGIWSLNGAWKNHLIPTAKRRGFLGIAGYYRRCIKNFDKISGSLNNHLKSNAFKWTSDAEVAFEGLKKALAEAPVIIESDASGYGIGAALMQDKGPIAYFSKLLRGKHLYLSTHEKEMMALLRSVQRWTNYLLDRDFIVRTVHASLKHFWEQQISTTTQHKWQIKLLGYDFTIECKPGRDNNAADSLLEYMRWGMKLGFNQDK